MEAEAEILQPFELRFSDLLLLTSSPLSSFSAELVKLEIISRTVMETLGPSGPGLLSITGVPNASILRGRLLPLARKLALLRYEDCRRVLKVHKLGTDVPLKNLDRSVSSFALQLKYAREPSQEYVSSDSSENNKKEHVNGDGSQEPHCDEFRNLGDMFEELGFCMMELGLRLAQLCDKAIGGHELEQSILESCTAKGRLIHYHSSFDNHILKEARRAEGSKRGSATNLSPLMDYLPVEETNSEGKVKNGSRTCKTSASHLWQQWHYDYGIFTVLTTPMFLSSIKDKDGVYHSTEREMDRQDGHSYLQILCPSKNKIFMVQPSPGSFIVQIGESADILSKGKLQATLHSVCRPVTQETLSRETFVVFLLPAWGKVFSTSDYPLRAQERLTLSGHNEGIDSALHQVPHNLSEQIHTVLPPLSSRLKDGMTFAEFSQQTTKQYYGGSGFQSARLKTFSRPSWFSES